VLSEPLLRTVVEVGCPAVDVSAELPVFAYMESVLMDVMIFTELLALA